MIIDIYTARITSKSSWLFICNKLASRFLRFLFSLSSYRLLLFLSLLFFKSRFCILSSLITYLILWLRWWVCLFWWLLFIFARVLFKHLFIFIFLSCHFLLLLLDFLFFFLFFVDCLQILLIIFSCLFVRILNVNRS